MMARQKLLNPDYYPAVSLTVIIRVEIRDPIIQKKISRNSIICSTVLTLMWETRTNLVVQRGNLLLIGCGEQEAAHLCFKGIFHLYINVIARCLFLIISVDAVQK